MGLIIPLLILVYVYFNHLSENLSLFFSNLIIVCILILISNVLINNSVSLILKYFALLLFNLLVFIQLSHFYLFNDKIRSSSIFIMLNSNKNETTEFFSMYFDKTLCVYVFFLLLGILLTILAYYLDYRNNRKLADKIKTSKNYYSLRYFSICLILFSVFIFSYEIRSATLPHVVYTAYKNYIKQNQEYIQFNEDKNGGIFSNVKHKESMEQEVYVLIIGESTSKLHMQLYDYYRDTNPNLKNIDEELIVYKNVISPYTHTIQSLEKSLTLATHKYPERKKDGTVIQLFNKAGFRTTWISNQIPFGLYETGTTIISKSCDQQIFTNVASAYKKSYDEKVLKPFREILKYKTKKQFIIIHLYGTHSRYSKRYPEGYNFFKEDPITKFKSEKSIELINSYDNAVRYNDFIVSEIINETKKINAKSYVIYFSDHGEEVYDNNNFAGHSHLKKTKTMFDIPFILWRSEKFKYDDKFTYDVKRKYSTEDLIYSLGELSNIKFKELDSTRSIFNKYYIERKRYIAKNEIYENVYGN